MRVLRSLTAAFLAAAIVDGVHGRARGADDDSATGSTPAMAAKPSKPAEISAADRRFFRAAYSDAVAEISIGGMAAQKGTNAQVRHFGERLETNATRELADLMDLASKDGIRRPKALEPRDRAAIRHLSTLSGGAFDQDFLFHVQEREQALIAQMERESTVGANHDLGTYADHELATVRSQIDQARRIHDTVRPHTGVAAPQKRTPQ